MDSSSAARQQQKPRAKSTALHRALNLYISPDAYVFEPTASEDASLGIGERQTLVIERRTGNLLLDPPNRAPIARESVVTVHGILGLVSLYTTDYLIVITHKASSCRFLGHDIHRASSFRLLPISPSAPSPPPKVEADLLALLHLGLNTSNLFFSYTWDLTHSLERHWRGDKARGGKPAWGGMAETADDRFFWNKALMRSLLEAGGGEAGGRGMRSGDEPGELCRFILPVMFGSFELRQITLSGRPLLFGLISRRSRHRAGTRFFRRGLDDDGNAANYVETEQILVLDPATPTSANEKSGGAAGLPSTGVEGRERFSFVQIRGSAPVFWAQINNLRYTPDLQIMDLPETVPALRAHISEQIAIYGDLHLVNLVNSVKYERPVKEAFERALLALAEPRAKYLYFDFHKECKGMRFERVSAVVDQLRGDLEAEGFFHHVGPVPSPFSNETLSPQPRKVQKSVVRTNCMDSLDRTNVVQSALARHVLDKQLRAAGALGANDSVENHADFMFMFRNVWADHADSVSTSYSGTGALKTDFTRTGKRTTRGAAMDGWNSVVRYVKNNYLDGKRQDAFDLLTGAWVIRRGAVPPLMDTRPFHLRILPQILIASLSILLLYLFSSHWIQRPLDLSLLFFFSLAFLSSLTLIWLNGVQFVAWPRLNRVTYLSYDGPGHRSTPKGRGGLPRSSLPRLPLFLSSLATRFLRLPSSLPSSLHLPRLPSSVRAVLPPFLRPAAASSTRKTHPHADGDGDDGLIGGGGNEASVLSALEDGGGLRRKAGGRGGLDGNLD